MSQNDKNKKRRTFFFRRKDRKPANSEEPKVGSDEEEPSFHMLKTSEPGEESLRLTDDLEDPFEEDSGPIFGEEKEDDTDEEETPRKKKKKQLSTRERRTRLLRGLIISVALLFVTAVGVFVLSPYFPLKQVILLGNNTMTTEELEKQVFVDYSRNIFRIDVGELAEKLREDPYTKNVKVSRRLPDTLVFELDRRSEVASIAIENGFLIIDEEGIVLRLTQEVSQIAKPLITGVQMDTVKVGDQLVFGKESNLNVLEELIKNIKTSGVLGSISELRFADYSDIHLITERGIDVQLGNGQDINQKMLQLKQILVDLNSKGAENGILNMRYKSYPVYTKGAKSAPRPKKTAPPADTEEARSSESAQESGSSAQKREESADQ